MRHLKTVLAALLVVLGLTWAGRARAALQEYNLYVIWIQGEGEGNQAELDKFIDSLFHRTDYEGYWGNVLIKEQGSYVVPKPAGSLGDAPNLGPYIDSLINSGKIPKPLSYGTPVYEVLVDPYQTDCVLSPKYQTGTGGRNAPGPVQGKTAGLILNTTNTGIFWPNRLPIGAETQLTEHEVAEVIDGLRGGDRCCGDFCCEGWCGSAASCGNFYGLVAPGSPASTLTGAGACPSVKGWLLQTLTHAGATSCGGSPTCDFRIGDSCSTDLKNLHSPCTADADCCSGLSCQKWTYSGHADDPATNVCCKAQGASCTSATDCCGGMNCDANSHQCVCVAAGQACSNDTDCCSGLSCQTGKCATKPAGTDGGADAGSDAAASHPDGGEAGVDGGVVEPPPENGCTCRASGRAPSRGGFALSLLAALALLRRRQRV